MSDFNDEETKSEGSQIFHPSGLRLDAINDSMIPTDMKLQKVEPTLSMSASEMKRIKWNEYMRNFNAKKRKEQKERAHKVMVSVGGKEKLYDESDIRNILIDSINLFIQILNENSVFNDRTLLFAFNACSGDIVKMYELIIPLVKQLINPQTDDDVNDTNNLNHQSVHSSSLNEQYYQTNNLYE